MLRSTERAPSRLLPECSGPETRPGTRGQAQLTPHGRPKRIAGFYGDAVFSGTGKCTTAMKKRKSKVGRRTKLNASLRRELCKLLADVCTVQTACQARGVSETSFSSGFAVARQAKDLGASRTGLQKVSAQLELNKPTPQMVADKTQRSSSKQCHDLAWLSARVSLRSSSFAP